jgi:ferredoxin
MNYTSQIQDIAARLFSEGKIDVFIGTRETGYGNNQVPVLISNYGEVDQLIFNERSVFNPANYLKREHIRSKRAGLVAKGCDSRAINLLITEGQVKRENLYIIGVACEGVVDDGGNKAGQCIDCVMPDAVIYDEFLGNPAGKKEYHANAEVIALTGKELTERGAYFEQVFSACIRCNACRHSCPLCYCEKCCIDQETSSLYHGANTTSSAFHALMTWSLHLAGRCVDCRNCEQACPMNLPLHLLHKQNEMVIFENFQGHLAGVEAGDRGAFYKYSLSDPDDFIM